MTGMRIHCELRTTTTLRALLTCREVMTFDDAGGSYWGPVASVDGTVLTTAADCKATSEEWGGWAGGSIVILNGTGAGQWRRIVTAVCRVTWVC